VRQSQSGRAQRTDRQRARSAARSRGGKGSHCPVIVLSEGPLVIPPDLWRARHYRPRDVQPRSRGPHVMAIVKRLAIAAGKLEEGDWPGFDEPSYPLLPLIGEIWEDSRAATMGPELAWQPGELERDGIYGSPDGILEMVDYPADWEAKATTA